MKFLEFMISYGQVNVAGLLICTLLLYLYFTYNRKEKVKKVGQNISFFTGFVLLFIVSVSPLEFLGRFYLFSAHMMSHVLLLLIIPPLLLNGISAEFWMKMVEKQFVKKIFGIMKPSVFWMFGVVLMWILHIPAIHTLMNQSLIMMNVQLVLLLVFGVIFIWPVYAPFEWKKLGTLESVVYLFTACVGCTVLGIFISFTPFRLYGTCMIGQIPEILSLVRYQWGLLPGIDQQIGGLIMWVPACLIYLTNIIITMVRWFHAPDIEEVKHVI